MGHAGDNRYAPRSQDDVLRLRAAQPFPWLVSAGGEDAAFTSLPLRVELDTDSSLVALHGHLARLHHDGRAQARVIGSRAHVSPSWLDDSTQTPSWNYTSVMFDLDIAVSEQAAEIRAELDALVTQMEAGRPRAWTLEGLGERHGRLAADITALRGAVREVRATLKLGQGAAWHDFAQLSADLQTGGEQTLVGWMHDFAGDAEESA